MAEKRKRPVKRARKVGHVAPLGPADYAAPTRRKLSIVVPTELIAWVTAQSNTRDVSVSSIFVEAMQQQRCRSALQAYLAESGCDDITAPDMAAFYAELRGDET